MAMRLTSPSLPEDESAPLPRRWSKCGTTDCHCVWWWRRRRTRRGSGSGRKDMRCAVRTGLVGGEGAGEHAASMGPVLTGAAGAVTGLGAVGDGAVLVHHQLPATTRHPSLLSVGAGPGNG